MSDRSSVVGKMTAMKNAGFHPVMIVVITVLSTPGIWQQFFDDTDEQALAAIEKAYPLLAKDAADNTEARKRQNDINQKILIEIERLKVLVVIGRSRPFADMPVSDLGLDDQLMGLGGGEGAFLMDPEDLFPAAADGDSDSDEEGAEEACEGAVEPPPPPDPEKKGSLDDLIQRQQQIPVRRKLPDLGELLGGK